MEAHFKTAQTPTPQPGKQPWRKPTITFVPLQITAQTSGSGGDGGTFEPIPG